MKYVRVTMPDGSQWDIPAMYIAHHRAAYYASQETDTRYVTIYDNTLAFSDLLFEWADNRMSWDEIRTVARRVVIEADIPLYQDAWPNALKEIIEQ